MKIGSHQEELEVGSIEASLAVNISKSIIVNKEEGNGKPRSKMEELRGLHKDYIHPVEGRAK